MSTDEIMRLYDVADDYEASVLDELRVKAGITWECPVRPWTNIKGEPCDNCGLTEDEATIAADMLDDDDETGTCDTCGAEYPLAERSVTGDLSIRCGECGNCSLHCPPEHKEYNVR